MAKHHTNSRRCDIFATGGLHFFVLILSALQCMSCYSHDADISTFSLRSIAGGRVAVVKTPLRKVKRALVAGCAHSFVPVESGSFCELTDGKRFDMLAR